MKGKLFGAGVLLVLGGLLVSVSLIGGGSLSAAGVAATGIDYGQIILWSGVGALVISAILFVLASS